MSATSRDERARDAQGRTAGIASRLGANGIDGIIVQGIYVLLLAGVALARFLLTDESLHIPRPAVGVTVGAEWLLLTLYLAIGWGGDGRTLGKRIMGLRVVSRDRRRLRPLQALGRAVLCVTIGWMLLLWILVSRDNLGAHDLVCRTRVLYDWSADSTS